MESNKLNIEIDRYLSNTKKSRILQEKASKYLPGGSTREAQYFDPYPIFIDYGKGHYIYDVDGNEYLDFVINATSLILGHSHPGIVERLKYQASKGTAFSGPVEDLINLSEVLCERIPSLDTVRFTNSGTEATLLAIRAARAFTKKNKIAKFEGGYHGAHESVAISVNPAVNDLTDDIDPVRGYIGQPEGILNDVVILPFNDLDVCESKLREYKDSLACVIMEPVISSFCYTPLDLPEPPEYSVDEVKQWIIKNTDELQECVKDLCSRGMAAQEIGYKYPWRLVFAFWDEYGGWLNDFDKKFPELSKYMHEVYNISENELTSIILLPMNNNLQGRGFWHNDGDRGGYRMYLNYENFDEDSLLLRKTKEPYNYNNWEIIDENNDEWDDSILQKKEYKSKKIRTNQ